MQDEHIAIISKMINLTSLDISRTKTSDKGAVYISNTKS